MDPNHDDDDHPSATISLPIMCDDDDDGDDEDSFIGSGSRPPLFISVYINGRVIPLASPPPSFNSVNINGKVITFASPPPSFNYFYLNGIVACRAHSCRPPSFPNSDNLKPNWLKEVVTVSANTTHEADNIIPEEEAVCRFCFHRLFPVDINNNNVMKTKCGCPLTLTHENCVINNNNKCDKCDQDVSYIRVTLSRASIIRIKKKVDDRGSSSRSSILTKWNCFKTIS